MKLKNINTLEEIDDLISKEMSDRHYISQGGESIVAYKPRKTKKIDICEDILSVAIKFTFKTYSRKTAIKALSTPGKYDGCEFLAMADWDSRKKAGLIEIIHRKYFKTSRQYYKAMFHELGHLIAFKFNWPMSHETHEIMAESFSCYVLWFCEILTKKTIDETAEYFLDSYASGSPSRGTLYAKKAFKYLIKRCEKKLS